MTFFLKGQKFDIVWKMTEWSHFIFKANYSTSQQSKSMSQPLMPKKRSGTVLWRPTRLSRTNSKKKKGPFHHRGLEWKSQKSRNTWSNRQVWPWSTKWGRANANRVLLREHTGHSKHSLPTTQGTTLHMDITRWSISNQINYILCNWRWRSSTQSTKTRPWAPYCQIQT